MRQWYFGVAMLGFVTLSHAKAEEFPDAAINVQSLKAIAGKWACTSLPIKLGDSSDAPILTLKLIKKVSSAGLSVDRNIVASMQYMGDSVPVVMRVTDDAVFQFQLKDDQLIDYPVSFSYVRVKYVSGTLPISVHHYEKNMQQSLYQTFQEGLLDKRVSRYVSTKLTKQFWNYNEIDVDGEQTQVQCTRLATAQRKG